MSWGDAVYGSQIFSIAAPETWTEKALCAQVDPELFYPETGGSTSEAKQVCMGCDVRQACLDFALQGEERFGVWGGYSERERRRLLRGEVFEPSRIGGRKRRDRHVITCVVCEVEYDGPWNGKYCSPKCKNAALYERQRAKRGQAA